MQTNPSMILRVLDTRAGRPTAIGATSRGDVTSAIRKSSVDTAALALGALNLAGDDQADRSVHGGPDKSVYCYPSKHAAAWHADGFELPPGSVGENVVLQGALEDDVRIGDIWTWGSATVQISQPRSPCFKLALATGRKDIAQRLIVTGRSGWYLRTLTEGIVETRGTFELVERDDTAPTVAECFAVMFHGLRAEADDPEIVARVMHAAALAPEWLGCLRGRNQLAG